MRAALYAIGILVGGIVIAAMLVDEGDLVTLQSVGAEGRHWETQLWLVELAGVPYLRSNSPDEDWLERIRVRPEVEIRRGEATGHWLATPTADPDLLEQVNRAMAAKYGTADRLLCLAFDREQMVAVRLSPASGP